MKSFLRTSLLSILLFSTSLVFGQDENFLDSLKRQLKFAKHDTDRVKILNEITEICNEPDIASYSFPSIKLAQKWDFKKGEAKAWGNLLFYYHHIGNNDSAFICLNKAITIAKEIKDYFGLAASYNNMGYIYQRLGENEKALHAYDSCVTYYTLSKSTYEKAIVYLNIGNLYETQGNSKKALDYYFKGLDLYKSVDDKTGIGYAYYCLGTLFEKQNDFEKAEKYYRYCMDLRLKTKDMQGYSVACSALGVLLEKKGHNQEALHYFQEALKVSEQLNFPEGISAALNNLGLYEQKGGNYKEALNYFEKSLVIANQLGMVEGITIGNSNLGFIYFMLKDYGKAEKYALKALALARQASYPNQIRRAAEILKNIYTATGKYKDALEMTNLFYLMRDSVSNEETRKAALEKELGYEYSMKEAMLKADQEKKNVIAKEEKEKQQIVIYLVSAGLLMVLLLSAFILKGYRQKKKANVLLEQKNELIEEQKKIVEEKNKDITDSINYAKRIQTALLANDELLANNLDQYFVLFKPKDIVSGDFYWAARNNNNFFVAACDSTGHGVPGAFMSLLNIGFLSEAIKEKNISDPHKIFDYVRERLVENISRDGQKDGMDGILMRFEKINGISKITYSAANNAPILIRGESFVDLNTDKMPVGVSEKANSFSHFEIEAQAGDMIYLYTDGYADQFGGVNGKKFKYKPLNNKLLEISKKPLAEQREILDQTFESWKGVLEQVDDVLIIGIRV